MAWTAGGRHARIAQEDPPRIEVQIPDRHRRMQPVQPHRPHADLAAARLDQRTESLGRVAGARVNPDRRAAHVVAVEALSPVDVELDLLPRSQDRRQLEADDGIHAGAGVQRIVGVDGEPIDVGAKPDRGPEKRSPIEDTLAE